MHGLSVRTHHVVLTVTDMEVSRQWYRELLGLEPVIDEAVEPLSGHHQGYYHVVFSLPGGLWLGLHSHAATDKNDTFSELRPGLDHVAFSAEGRTEIEAWQQRLTDLGIKHSGIVEDKYALNLSFRDPDGVALEFWAPLDRG